MQKMTLNTRFLFSLVQFGPLLKRLGNPLVFLTAVWSNTQLSFSFHLNQKRLLFGVIMKTAAEKNEQNHGALKVTIRLLV